MSRPHESRPPRGQARGPLARASRRAAVAALAAAALAPRSARAETIGEPVRLAPKSDMQITAVASAGFAAGANGTYTLTVDNNGPQSAAGPHTVTNTLAAGLTYVSASGAGWACSSGGQVVTCTWAGTYSKNNPTTITIVVSITNTVATSVTNVATVSDNGDDSNLANNSASTTSAVTVRRVATTPDAAAVSQLPSNGVNYSQTFVVANTGSMADSYALVATVAPAGIVSVVSVAGTAGSSAITVPAIAAGGTRTVAVAYTVATGAATGASAKLTLTATSTVAGTTTDPGDVTVTVARAGLTMTKQLYRDDRATLVAAGAKVSTGEYVQYRVTLTNGGTASATALSVTDPIPGAVTYDSATPDAAGWTIATAAGTLTASLSSTIAAGTSRYFWIRVQVK